MMGSIDEDRYLRRLNRNVDALVALERGQLSILGELGIESSLARSLLEHAIYSDFLGCCRLGIREKAVRLLEDAAIEYEWENGNPRN